MGNWLKPINKEAFATTFLDDVLQVSDDKEESEVDEGGRRKRISGRGMIYSHMIELYNLFNE